MGDTKQGMKAMLASLTTKQFTFFIGPAMPQKDYLKVGKRLAEAGKLIPHIDDIFSVQDTAKAIAYAIEAHPQGKLVIKTDF
ncbi:hypothetical protein FC07_GL001892 [Loigolactobacillus bifermentans DSM 20003]|uniref:Zinc-binding dehydrogenase n=2 Tax=Loigolactobacillus bifermentans TaxID=1607 RepID=A0A0R1GN01_9LACO|nr:hypothetical protein FC07_GL001892 [Loigolactobacillus bifermentans DSM 20003]